MKASLTPGIMHSFTYRVPANKTVPSLYEESAEFAAMPEVFATGFMVGFIEWACVRALEPHLDWPSEQTVGTHVDLSHTAATPAGMDVTADVTLVEVDGRRLVFDIEARDECDVISRGRHERVIIDKTRFEARVKSKGERAGS